MSDKERHFVALRSAIRAIESAVAAEVGIQIPTASLVAILQNELNEAYAALELVRVDLGVKQ